MHGNATLRHTNTSVLSVTAVDAPEVVPSSMFDERLAETYERLEVRGGLLEEVAGIKERRWWDADLSFADAASLAGETALVAAGIDRQDVGLLIDTSVSRDHLEPSAAVAVHHALGLSTACINFDLANACLGFVNAMSLAAYMIDAGQIEYALIVDGEGSRRPQETTLERLAGPDATKAQLFGEFATLTLGSGSAGMVLGRSDAHPEGHRLLGGEARTGSQHHQLCYGDLDRMWTDTAGLLEAGLAVADETWAAAARNGWEWSTVEHFIMHQVSAVHTMMMQKQLGIDPEKAPLTFPTYGNIGPASIPTTLAKHAHDIVPGDRVVLTGIGSGINTTAVELLW